MASYFFHPSYYPRTTLALPPSSSSDPGSHSGPYSPFPSSLRFTNAFIFYRENMSALSSLVDSRRIVLTHAARRSQQLLVLFFSLLQIHFLLF